ncbi:hypothetical protein MP228_008883 [Amoeboaphelidium protococcarum]|nr:hypothetical protein MP228_008883 [Amoeboaphelidium protococcarum]
MQIYQCKSPLVLQYIESIVNWLRQYKDSVEAFSVSILRKSQAGDQPSLGASSTMFDTSQDQSLDSQQVAPKLIMRYVFDVAQLNQLTLEDGDLLSFVRRLQAKVVNDKFVSKAGELSWSVAFYVLVSTFTLIMLSVLLFNFRANYSKSIPVQNSQIQNSQSASTRISTTVKTSVPMTSQQLAVKTPSPVHPAIVQPSTSTLTSTTAPSIPLPTQTAVQQNSLNDTKCQDQVKLKTALCITGAVRSFLVPEVHQSIQKYVIDALHADGNDVDVYFDAMIDQTCDASMSAEQLDKFRHCKRFLEIAKSMSAKVIQTKNEIECSSNYLKDHRCCQNDIHADQQSFAGFFQYQRKRHCLELALKNKEYDFYVMIRPDLVWYEPIPSTQYLNRLTPRMFLSSKEYQEAIGDFVYLFPRSILPIMLDKFNNYALKRCENQKSIMWPPEYEMQPQLEPLPHQVLPLLFSIVRMDGSSDCFRLNNEVLRNSNIFFYNDKQMTAEGLCRAYVEEGKFKFPYL